MRLGILCQWKLEWRYGNVSMGSRVHGNGSMGSRVHGNGSMGSRYMGMEYGIKNGSI